jgi:hypothetical protein
VCDTDKACDIDEKCTGRDEPPIVVAEECELSFQYSTYTGNYVGGKSCRGDTEGRLLNTV